MDEKIDIKRLREIHKGSVDIGGIEQIEGEKKIPIRNIRRDT